MSDKPDKGFVGRWAKRKSQARAQQEPDREVQPQEVIGPADARPEETDSQVLQRLGLPEPEALKAGDDFKVFLNAALPATLRRRALRQLWAVNPALANLDGLLDYGEDFTGKASVGEKLKTAWSVGRGYAEKARANDAPKIEETAGIEVPEAGELIESNPAEERIQSKDATAVQKPANNEVAAPEEEMEAPQIARRMRFHFEKPV